MLIKLSQGLVYVLSVKYKNQTVRNPNFNVKRKNDDKKKKEKRKKTLVQQSKAEDKCLNSNVRKPRSKVLHLALLAWLGKEGRHTKSLIR